MGNQTGKLFINGTAICHQGHFLGKALFVNFLDAQFITESSFQQMKAEYEKKQ